MLLIIKALLLIFAALGQDHRAVEGQIYPLDMALDSVDDQYDDCRKEMANLVEKKYLNKETSDPHYQFAWKTGESYTSDEKLTRKHITAILVYTNELYRDFNSDTRQGKDKYKRGTYKLYSLQFLLTEAIQILKSECYDTYHGTKDEFNKNVLNKAIRFGSFASSSLEREATRRFGNKSCFVIHTCEGADVTKYSVFNDEKEVLIPPYEMFKVTAVMTRKDQEDLWCDTVYTLKHSRTKSDLDCAVAPKKSNNLKKHCCG